MRLLPRFPRDLTIISVLTEVVNVRSGSFLGFSTSIDLTFSEIAYAISNLRSWAKPTSVRALKSASCDETKVTTPWLQMKGLSSSYVQSLPLGVVLIIGVRLIICLFQ